MTSTIKNNWLQKFKTELIDVGHVKIVSPFITDNMVRHLVKNFTGTNIQIITRYNLNDFKKRVSSLKALSHLLDYNAEIKSVKNLHSKLYIFDTKSVIITSANFTNGGFFTNKEFGIFSNEKTTVEESTEYFKSLWSIDENLLDKDTINDWEKQLANSKTISNSEDNLNDYGASYKDKILQKRRFFIKFFGKDEHRASHTTSIRDELEGGCSHFALSFSRKSNDKRPRKYRNNDVVYIARMIQGNDYAIYGKAQTISHLDQRDVASQEDIKHIPWLEEWPILVRVKYPEFIDSTLGNCPTMSGLIGELDYDCFDKTAQKHKNGVENINPWNSLRQQADVQLSESGAIWMEEKFNDAINKTAKIPEDFINSLYSGLKIKN